MKKVFHFDSSSEQYVADAAVVCCFDQRIRLAVHKFLRRRGVPKPDMIVVAGGAKTLASPRSESERGFILDQLRMSMSLHGTTRAFLMIHSDCGTYGGLAAFNNDPEMEKAHHEEELRRAAELLQARCPELEVQRFLVTFEGVFAVDDPVADQAA